MIAFQMGWLALLGAIELFAAEWSRTVSNHRRRLSNLAFLAVNHVALPPLALLLVHALAPLRPHHGLGSLPVYVGLPLAIIALDLSGYWFHRLSHRIPFMWRFHQVHHLDEDFDFTTGARVHTFESLLHQGVSVVVATLLGIPAGYMAVFATLAFAFAVFHHTNVAIPWKIEKWLRLVIVTPALHVPHHHEQIRDTDTNFGFILPWWDRMFGTYNTRQRTPEWRIGLDYSNDLGFLRLVIQPFLPTRLKDSATPPQRNAAPEGSEVVAA